jgi:hypothetical protein
MVKFPWENSLALLLRASDKEKSFIALTPETDITKLFISLIYE